MGLTREAIRGGWKPETVRPAVAAGLPVILAYGEVRVDLVRLRVFVGDREVKVTPAQFRLLECLLGTPGRAFSREELMAVVLRSGTSYSRTIDVHVKELRRKLGRPGLIKSVYGVGYRLGVGGKATG